jgi:hypothetical protein
MGEDRWRSFRESGFRVLFAGLFSLIITFMLYSRLTVPSSEIMVQSTQLMSLAYGVLAITAAAAASMIYGGFNILRSEQMRTAGSNSLIAFVTGAFATRDYWKIMAVASLGYGILFGFLSQILVYRTDVSLIGEGIIVPSTHMIPCCGAPGYVPMLTIYLTDHFLILLIPVNVILAIAVSVLVGINTSIAIYAYRLKKSIKKGTSLVGGIGASSGLFVGCPTCAGSIFSALLGIGVAGAGTSAAVVAPMQTLFIAASIPALLVAPVLIGRTIRSVSSCRLT